MKHIAIIIFSLFVLYACNQGANKPSGDTATNAETPAATENSQAKPNPPYDPDRGVGKFTHVDVNPELNIGMAQAGKSIYDVKCVSCHKLTNEKLVGPGWKGVTQRYKPEWIMNFITNPDAMLDKDPKAQAQLEICLVRMPNQNLSDDNARHLLEFMRQNDGVK